jgi:hypothetical protein
MTEEEHARWMIRVCPSCGKLLAEHASREREECQRALWWPPEQAGFPVRNRRVMWWIDDQGRRHNVH